MGYDFGRFPHINHLLIITKIYGIFDLIAAYITSTIFLTIYTN
jgi:hypothetical protein